MNSFKKMQTIEFIDTFHNTEHTGTCAIIEQAISLSKQAINNSHCPEEESSPKQLYIRFFAD
ncbi:MAG: hypothetical protein C0623_11120 [Desulfuromonas sp.]|nr:MAG: hypothetical protein C0623_11120 [Desulfuromonas sp.]